MEKEFAKVVREEIKPLLEVIAELRAEVRELKSNQLQAIPQKKFYTTTQFMGIVNCSRSTACNMAKGKIQMVDGWKAQLVGSDWRFIPTQN